MSDASESIRRSLLRNMEELWRETYWYHTKNGEPATSACSSADEAVNRYYQVALFVAKVVSID